MLKVFTVQSYRTKRKSVKPHNRAIWREKSDQAADSRGSMRLNPTAQTGRVTWTLSTLNHIEQQRESVQAVDRRGEGLLVLPRPGESVYMPPTDEDIESSDAQTGRVT
jgi:hypothetical protein